MTRRARSLLAGAASLAMLCAGVAPASPQGAPPTSAASAASATSPAPPTANPSPQDPGKAPGAPAFEPYRFNARERTASALHAWEKGRPEDAVAALDSALRLQPGNPLVEYNAGTAHLGAKQGDAAQLLEQAAKHAPAALAADAFYNLGNARLEAKDPAGAIDAYKSALRARSDAPDAKRNLELALRMLEEQKKQQEKQQKDQQQKDGQKDQQQGGGKDQEQKPDPQGQGSGDQPPPKSDPAKSDPNGAQSPPQPGQGDPQSGDQNPPSQSPLPQFKDQKDMTAEQAAAILQAVENLERQQRRDQARAVARAKTSVEKDW